jgi:small-conductance mechanosensitive channel
MGTVTKTNLRDTVIETKAQKPYSTFAYADDPEKVEDVVLSAIKNLEGVIDKDLMVLTILNLTLVPSILIFDFGLNIRRTQLLQDEKQSYQSEKKAFDEQDITIPFPLEHWTLELKGAKTLPNGIKDKWSNENIKVHV